MGVIRKKTVTRGTEGGLKYICDVCSADITSTVSTLRCYFPLIRLLPKLCPVDRKIELMLAMLYRFEYDVLALFAMTMIFAYPALLTGQLLVVMILQHIVSPS